MTTFDEVALEARIRTDLALPGVAADDPDWWSRWRQHLAARAWAPRVVQAALLLGSLEWVRTLWTAVAQRQAAGEPWLRMALILGAVALFTALSGLFARGPERRSPST